MNIEEVITSSVRNAVQALYGADVPENQIQLQKTKKEFEGHLTLVVFPFLRLSRQKPEETAEAIGAWLLANEPAIEKYNVIAYVIIIFVWMFSCFILSFIQFIFIAVIVIKFTHNLTSLIKNKGECKLHSPKFSCSNIIFSWNFLLVLVQLLWISYQIQIHRN